MNMGRLFAIGDIHGCFDQLYELVTEVISLKKEDRLILLGDYIDRGSQSREVIDFIIDLKAKGFDIKPLMGNHENMLLESYTDPEMIYQWYMNSGESTLKSLEIENIREINEKYLNFFSRLDYYETAGDFLFVHAGFNDREEDPFRDKYHMIWESRLSYSNPVFAGKKIIHGHRPKTLEYVREQIRSNSKVIPIDTGCVYGTSIGYGYLTALDVNQMKLYSVINDQ